MNFMLEGKNSAELTNLIGSGNPNMEAIKFIKPELLKNPAIFPDKAMQAKLEEIPIDHETAPVDAVMTAESAYLEVTLK